MAMSRICYFPVVSKLIVVSLFSLLITCPQTACAEYIEPGTVEVATDWYQPQEPPQLAQGSYQYSVSWQGIPVARATIDIVGGYLQR